MRRAPVCGKLRLDHKYRCGAAVVYTRRYNARVATGNEHLRAGITVNVGQCVFMRRLAGEVRNKLVSGSRAASPRLPRFHPPPLAEKKLR